MEIQPKVIPAYYPYLFDYSHRYEVWWGTRSSGKSYFVTEKVIYKALTSKRKVLFAMNRANRLRQAVWSLTIDRLQHIGIIKLCKVKEHVYEIDLPNGSQFIYKGG